MKPEEALTEAFAENKEPVLYSLSYPLRVNEDGEERERLFFYLDVSAPSARNPYLELKMSHVRRRTPEEMVEGQPEKIWKKVRGEESKFKMSLMGLPSWALKRAATDWLEETLTADNESTLLSLLPEDEPLAPVKKLLNTASVNNAIAKSKKHDPHINGEAVFYEPAKRPTKTSSAFSFNLSHLSSVRNDG